MYVDFLASLVIGSAMIYSTRILCRELGLFRSDLRFRLNGVAQAVHQTTRAIDRQTAMLEEDALELHLEGD